MEQFGFLMIFGIVAAGIYGYGVYQNKMIAGAWEEAARMLGIGCKKGGIFSTIKISGSIRGRSVSAWIRSDRRRSGKHRRTYHYTIIEVGLSNPDWFSCKISREGFGAKVSTFFGGQDIEVGDQIFDKKFRIQGDLPPNVREALGRSQVQSEILGMSTGFHSFLMEKGKVRVENEGRIRDASRLRRYIERVIERVENLDAALSGKIKEEKSAEQDLFPEVEPVSSQESSEKEPLW